MPQLQPSSNDSRVIHLRFRDGREKLLLVAGGYVYTPMTFRYIPRPAEGMPANVTWQSIVGLEETYWYHNEDLIDVSIENP